MGKGVANLGETIRRLRLSRGMEQKKLASYTGMTQSHLSKIETGKTNPSLEKLRKVAEVLGVNEKLLFFGNYNRVSLEQSTGVFNYLDKDLQHMLCEEESVPFLEVAKSIYQGGFIKNELEALKLVFLSRKRI